MGMREVLQAIRDLGDGLTVAEIADRMQVFKLAEREKIAAIVCGLCRTKLASVWKREIGHKKYRFVYKAC